MDRIQKRPRSKNDLKAFNFIEILEVIIYNLVTYEIVRLACMHISAIFLLLDHRYSCSI